MIHKYVIALKSNGKIYFASTKSDYMDSDHFKILEVLIPLSNFGEISILMEELDAIRRQGFEHYRIGELQKEIFSGLAPFATNEKDRTWFYGAGKKAP